MEPTVRRARIESAIVSEPARSALLGRPNSRPPAGQFRPEIQAPGTEFLDAETGGQKTARETLMVGRDRERGKWAARSPQKRPLFDRRRFPRFGKTGWWRRKGPNCQPPTQSSSNPVSDIRVRNGNFRCRMSTRFSLVSPTARPKNRRRSAAYLAYDFVASYARHSKKASSGTRLGPACIR